ncbi:MAG: CpaF family protein [Planctomycetota bacterium]|jgi:pilus assembly protein CpaF
MTRGDFLELPGYAPIRPLMLDPEVTEIMINGHREVFVERRGRMELSPFKFESEQQLKSLIELIVRPSGRSVDATWPYVDCRLPDGSRVNVIIPPLSLDGPAVTIRKFTQSLKDLDDLVRIGTLSEAMAELLRAAIRARLNIIFAGATGSGKTTTLGILGATIPESERIITIEDTAELNLPQKNVIRLECRRPSVEGTGEVTSEHLFRNSLRMRPTRIVVGEIRGAEAVEMIQAISSGHEGCLAVLHASSPADAVSRLAMMVLSRGMHLPLWAVNRQIAEAIDVIIQHELLPDGTRKITHITEVAGVDDDELRLQDLFEFRHQGPNETGKVPGTFAATGVEPGFLDKLRNAGVSVSEHLFKSADA